MADVKRLQIRRDTLADWAAVNPILLEGEVGLIIENGRISSLKIGDGVSSFAQLPQLTLLEAVFGGYVSRQDLSASLRDYATIQYVESEIGKILGGASGAYDTLKEIEDILKNDTTGLAALLEEIDTKADTRVVDALASRVSQNESNIADHTNKITANTDNIDSTIRRVAANEADLEKLNQTVDKIYGEYVTISDIPTKTSQLIDDIGYALARNIKALAGLDIVTKDYIADAAVTTSKIKDGAITRDKLSSAIQQQLDFIPSTTDNLAEGSSNFYFTNARAIAALSDTLKGYVTTLAFQDYAKQIQQNSTNITNLTKTVDEIYEEYVTWDNIPTKTSQLTNDSDFLTSQSLDGLLEDYAKKSGYSALKVLATDSDGNIVAHYVSTDKLGFLSNVTSDIQAQINALSIPDLDGYVTTDTLTESLNNLSSTYLSFRGGGTVSGATTFSGGLSVQNSLTLLGVNVGAGSSGLTFGGKTLMYSGDAYTKNEADKKFHPLTTVDTAPTLNSSNLVTSGGVAKAVADLAESADRLYQRKGSYLTASSSLSSSKLDKNTINIASTSVSLGGSITQNQLISNLGLKGLAFKDSIDLSGYQPLITSTNKLAYSLISGTPKLATVATSGSYNDLTNKPTIPNSGIIAGWGFILEPTLNNRLADYLPLDGGTIKSTVEQALTLYRNESAGGIGIKFEGEKQNGWVGYTPSSYGVYLYTNNHYLNLTKDGVAKLDANTLIHSGNISSYAVTSSNLESTLSDYPLANGTRATGTWGIDISGSANRLEEIIVTDLNSAPANRIFTMTSGYGSTDGNKPSTWWASGITFRMAQNDSYRAQLCTSDSEKLYYRVEHDGSWTDWKTIAFTDSTVAAATRIVNDNGDFVIYRSSSGNIMVGDNNVAGNTHLLGNNIYLRYGGSNAYGLILNSSGNVTIGSSDLAGTNIKLRVNGNAAFGTGSEGGCDVFFTRNSTNYLHAGTSTSDSSAGFAFTVGGKGSNNIAFRLESDTTAIFSGNVGIGTTNPNTRLHVVGGAKIEGALSSYGITATTTAATDTAFAHYVGSTKLWWVSSYNNCANFNTALYVQSGSSPIKVATVNDLSSYLPKAGGTISGSLTFSATSGSHIIGNSTQGISFKTTSNSNTTLYFEQQSANSYSIRSDDEAAYWNLGDDLNRFNVLYCRSVSQSSDATKKNILGNIGLTTSQIANAPAVNFTWKNGGAKDVGTIAQYWKYVLPEVVSGEEGSYGMNYAVLGVVSSIILARNIETHEQRIARLEKEISDLQKELNALVNNE